MVFCFEQLNGKFSLEFIFLVNFNKINKILDFILLLLTDHWSLIICLQLL